MLKVQYQKNQRIGKNKCVHLLKKQKHSTFYQQRQAQISTSFYNRQRKKKKFNISPKTHSIDVLTVFIDLLKSACCGVKF